MTVDVSSCVRCARPIPADSPSRSCDECRPFLVSTPRPAATLDDPLPPTLTADTPTRSDAGEVVEDDSLPVVDGYEIHEEIAAGGGGRVYHATQRIAKRRVALKTLTRGGNRSRFEREVRALAAMDHPNIVRVYEVGECDHGPYFSMEFAAGGTLADRLRRSGPMPAAEAAAVVEKAARGVAAAHDRKIGHRDIKPSNILLNAAGEPMVSDFGLAKEWHVEPSPDRSTADPKTAAGVFLGTPPYAAPEQAAGVTDEQDARTDVYGLGAVLYHALTGHPPFGGESTATTLNRVLTQPPIPPRRRVKTVPRSLEAICLKCLEKTREDRYVSATDLADDLARWRQGETPIARPLPRWKSAAGWMRRNGTTVALAVIVVGAAIAAATLLRRDDPESHLRRIDQGLRDGKTETLIEETGRPKWSRFAYGPEGFRESRYGEDVCSLESVRDTYVELLPAKSVPEAFRLWADIRHEFGSGPVSRCGLYWAFREETLEGGVRLTRWQRLMFNDFFQPPGAPIKDFPIVSVLQHGGWLQSPNERRDDKAMPIGNAPITVPPLGDPREWRRVEIEVSPNHVLAWISDGNSRVQQKPPVISSARLDEFQRTVDESLLGHPLPANPAIRWSSAGGIGLFVENGHASFRNVRIEPIAP